MLDVENTTLEKGAWINKDNRLVLACWDFQGEKKHTWGGELDQQELLADIAECDFIVCHNAKHELGWLARCGLDLRSVLVYDTMLGEWVIGGNRYSQLALLGLNVSLARHGLEGKDVVGGLFKLGVSIDNIPHQWLLDYCHADVARTKELFYKQLDILERDNLLHIQYARCLLVPVLTDMEAQGLTLDKDRVYEIYNDTLTKYNERLERLTEITGGINFKSRPQLAAFLYDTLGFDELKGRDKKPIRTPAGARKTDAGTLAKLHATTKAQREFTELIRELAKLNAALTKSLNFFKEICDNHDGTFYGILNQGTTATHRLSSSGRSVVLSGTEGKKAKTAGAQLQNIAREFKRFFRARDPDWLVLEADGAQLEFRGAAALGQDKVAIEEIINGADVHAVTAKTLTDAGEPTTRQEAKSRTFRPLFGGGSGTPAEQEYCKFFQSKYHEIYAEQTRWTHAVLRDKVLVTPWGMRFYWPDTQMTRSGYITNTTSIFNYPIQSLCTAEIIPITLIWLWYMTAGMRLKIVLTVHDSVIMEIHPDEVENVKPIIAECFTSRVYETLENLYNYEFKSVPLAAGIKVGKFWSEGEEVTATVFPNNRGVVHWKTK